MKRLSTGIVLSSIASTFLFAVSYDCPSYIVTSTGDDGNGTLRACVEKAKLDTLGSGLHTDISFDDNMHIILSSGSIKVSNGDSDQSMSIDGADKSIIIDGDDNSSIFSVHNGIALSLSNITLQNGNDALGGAIDVSYSDLNISDCNINNNSSESEGGAIYTTNSTVTISNSIITNNNAQNHAGAIYSQYGTLDIVDSNITKNTSSTKFGGGIYMNYGTLNLTRSTISDNNATGGGGIAIYNADMNVQISTLSGNMATSNSGGAIDVFSYYVDSTLHITNSSISSNSADHGSGGAILLYNSEAEINLNITGSTLSENNASIGGAIDLSTADGYAKTIVITNSTLSSNLATSNTGAISLDSTTSLTLMNATITNNSSNGSPAISEGSIVESSNSILSGNINGNDFFEVTSLGSNILGTGTVVDQNANDIMTTNPLLSPLGNYGGLTLTHLPMALSPAIDAGSSTLPTGQRGVKRPQGDAPDIGSVESVTTIVPIIMYLLN